ncbi:acetylornithine deacetylase [Marinibacterium sp. SX1]|uniref:acetylornithine deacetylase n=1 Tax=Marinibacterium sp. SX1 TaxID=3388424 RepID=UPI003D1675B5
MIHQTPTLDWLERLVAHQTTPDQSNLALIDEIEAYLLGFGIHCQRSYDETGLKANLLATIGDRARPGLILSGHTDVVSAENQTWSGAPFRLSVRNNKAFGRGACDMKGFLAVMLHLVPEFVDAANHTTVHLAFSYDEEIGCVGVRRLIPLFDNLPAKPIGCIVGEPTGMQVLIGHKGKSTHRVLVTGLEGHSSMPHLAVNAVEIAAELVAFLNQEASKRRAYRRDDRFNPPHTTVHTGLIHGGTAINIVPNTCSFDFEMRLVPGDDPQDILLGLQEKADELLSQRAERKDGPSVTIETLASYPGLQIEPTATLARLAHTASNAGDMGFVSFGTEAGLIAAAGIPAIVMGPGSITQAHKPDEFVAIDQLMQCKSALRRVVLKKA